jgi:hypothetical protein
MQKEDRKNVGYSQIHVKKSDFDPPTIPLPTNCFYNHNHMQTYGHFKLFIQKFTENDIYTLKIRLKNSKPARSSHGTLKSL